MSTSRAAIDSMIDVVTPENIAFQYEVAGPFRRLPAFLVDLVVRVVIWLAAFFLILFSGLIGSGLETLGLAIGILFWFVLEWFYGGLLETFWNGQTVGKRAVGLRVLTVDGQPINGLQAVMRNILRMVDLMPLVPLVPWAAATDAAWVWPTGLIGLITPVLNDRFQRAGDLVCGTMVIVEQKSWLLRPARLEDPRTQRLAAELPASFVVSRRLAQALAAYVERRRYLSASRRQAIANHLSQPLLSQFKLPADTNEDLLLCALYYRTFVAQSRGARRDPSRLSVLNA